MTEFYINPPQKGGFFYFTGVAAKQVAREGFSGEIKLCLNLNEVGNIKTLPPLFTDLHHTYLAIGL